MEAPDPDPDVELSFEEEADEEPPAPVSGGMIETGVSLPVK
jgi:hypothetical protein